MLGFIELTLTCADRGEADRIAGELLGKKLIACAKFLPVESKYWWQGKIEESKETLLLMESVEQNFDKIEAIVKKLHSYDTFVLQAMPISNLNKVAAIWLSENTK